MRQDTRKRVRRTKAEVENAKIAEALQIMESRAATYGDFVHSPDDGAKLARLRLQNREAEVFAVMFLNRKHKLISYDEMFYGTIDGASVYPREVVKAALKHNASAVVLSHNHPSGDPAPSNSDHKITMRLKEALALVDVQVLDHIVVGSLGGFYSFAQYGCV